MCRRRISIWQSLSLNCRHIWDQFPMIGGIFVICLLVLLQGTVGLKLTELVVPPHPVVGDSVLLRCVYDMEQDEIYSVKWYKSGAEFYRYHPKDRPPVQIYGVAGIQVDLKSSDRSTVSLQKVDLDSSGVYRCEVSAEAPSFTTVFDEGEMIVIDLPEEGPKITGGRSKYQVGDTVQVNCTSQRSKPAAMLAWTINGGTAHKGHLREFPPVRDKDGLETSVLGLEFRILEDHFKDGEIKLRCTASIAPVYHREESVAGISHYGSVLQSKGVANRAASSRGWTSSLSITTPLLTLLLLTFLLR